MSEEDTINALPLRGKLKGTVATVHRRNSRPAKNGKPARPPSLRITFEEALFIARDKDGQEVQHDMPGPVQVQFKPNEASSRTVAIGTRYLIAVFRLTAEEDVWQGREPVRIGDRGPVHDINLP